MKKTTKIILSVLAAVLVIAAGIGLYFAFPLLAMKPLETGQIPGTNPPIYALRSGRGNLFLVESGEGYLMIDAGANAKSVEAGLGKLGIEPAQVKAIFLTHTHSDHVAALPLFPHAEVYMGEGETPPPAGPETIQLLFGSEALAFGNVEVKCISAPWHTPGGMAYHVNDSFLFTGDALRYSNGQMSVHPFTLDKEQAETSIENIKALDFNFTIFTSHYGYHVLS